jgi:HEAT repeat protein
MAAQVQWMTSPLSAYLEDLGSPDKAVRNTAAQNLAASGDEAVPLILPLLDDESWVLRYRACEILGLMKNPANNSCLQRKLTDEKDHVRYMAVKGLGLSEDPAAVPAIIPMLSDENNFVRRISVLMLGHLGGGNRELKELQTRETDPAVRASLKKILPEKEFS